MLPRKQKYYEIIKNAINEGWDKAHLSEDVSKESIKENIFNSIKDKTDLIFKSNQPNPKTRNSNYIPEDGC